MGEGASGTWIPQCPILVVCCIASVNRGLEIVCGIIHSGAIRCCWETLLVYMWRSGVCGLFFNTHLGVFSASAQC